MVPESRPSVRVVVVNFNAGELLLRCFQHLVQTEWPSDALELVLVDNGSSDDSSARVIEAFPSVRLIRSPRNIGFGGANNLALGDLTGVDFIALVNPDAFVDPGWLQPLVEAVKDGDRVGAANPKIVFDAQYAIVDVEAEAWSPGPSDRRTLGIQIATVHRDGDDVWDAVVFGEGFHAFEASPTAPHFRWSGARATLGLPIPRDDRGPFVFELGLGEPRKDAVFHPNHGLPVTVPADEGQARIALKGPGTDVINSAGGTLVDGAYGADRCADEFDAGQCDDPAEIFAWTGAAVLLSAEYLRDVGLFDASFFLYSEDFDLSWRGRLRGWTYRYVPESRVRHIQGAIIGRRSATADHYAHRNALLAMVKSAPGSVARREFRAYLDDLKTFVTVEIVRPLRRGQRPQPLFARRRFRVVMGFLVHLPSALRKRRTIGRRALRDRAEVLRSAP